MILKPFMLRRIKCDVENELSEKVSVVHGERTGYYSDSISKPYIHSGQTLPLGNAFCYSILTTFPPDNDKNVSRLQCILKCTPVFDLKLKVVKYVMITLSLIGR